MHVLFVEPAFPRNQMHFVRALHSVGAAVTAIGDGQVDLRGRVVGQVQLENGAFASLEVIAGGRLR